MLRKILKYISLCLSEFCVKNGNRVLRHYKVFRWHVYLPLFFFNIIATFRLKLPSTLSHILRLSVLRKIFQGDLFFYTGSYVQSHLSHPHFCFREDAKRIKLPTSMEDAKVLASVLSNYKDEYSFTVLTAFCLTYILYPFTNPTSRSLCCSYPQ